MNKHFLLLNDKEAKYISKLIHEKEDRIEIINDNINSFNKELSILKDDLGILNKICDNCYYESYLN